MSDSLGVVVPAYDPDVPTLERYVADLRAVCDPATVRIELDAPRQADVDRLREVAAVNVSTARRGKGSAVMAGFDALDTDLLAFADADGSVPAASLADVVRQLRDDRADVSIGSRRHPSSEIVAHQTVVRRLLGDAFAAVAGRVLPTHCRDYQCGAKAVRAEAWDAIGHHCYEPGFAWDLEFVSVAGSLGYDIAEVPVAWEDHPDSTVEPVSTAVELGTALVDVRRRTDALAASPRYRDVQATDRSTLMRLGDGD